jgi:AcrR family transcriptional regulator
MASGAVRAAQAQQGPGHQGQETRERILEAALQVFSERGFDGATTREIASRADANVGLLQYYFGDKQSLWQTAVDRAFEDLEGGLLDLEAMPPAGDERERMRRLLRRYVRFVGRNPDFIRIMHDEGKRPGPRMRWLVDHHVKPLYEKITAWLQRAQREGSVPADIEPLHLHYILVGAVGLVFHQAAECRRLTGEDPADEAFIEAHAAAVERVLLGPPPEEKKP